MYVITRLKQILLLLGDALCLYLSLGILLVIRYGFRGYFFSIQLDAHLYAFSIIFPVWLFLFYVSGLYDLSAMRNNAAFSKKWLAAIFASGIISILYFYFIPVVITPKVNMFIFLGIFAATDYGWRRLFNFIIGARKTGEKLLFIGSGPVTEELIKHIEQNPQLGYDIGYWFKAGPDETAIKNLAGIVKDNEIKIIVIPNSIKKNPALARGIYRLFASGISVMDLTSLYEQIFSKVPLFETEEVWLFENISEHRRAYDALMSPFEKMIAALLLALLSPLFLVIAVLVFLTSRGAVILKQTRVGKYGRDFTLLKFRSMRTDAEKNGPQWAREHDTRTTLIGSMLRYTHLDELPQLINIAKGEMSFVGPRPERPEFVAQIKKDVPYFELRQLAKPGVTGWAQINYRYGASMEDAKQKLQYDLYYIKNRSLTLDLTIVLRTLKMFFIKL